MQKLFSVPELGRVFLWQLSLSSSISLLRCCKLVSMAAGRSERAALLFAGSRSYVHVHIGTLGTWIRAAAQCHALTDSWGYGRGLWLNSAIGCAFDFRDFSVGKLQKVHSSRCFCVQDRCLIIGVIAVHYTGEYVPEPGARMRDRWQDICEWRGESILVCALLDDGRYVNMFCVMSDPSRPLSVRLRFADAPSDLWVKELHGEYCILIRRWMDLETDIIVSSKNTCVGDGWSSLYSGPIEFIIFLWVNFVAVRFARDGRPYSLLSFCEMYPSYDFGSQRDAAWPSFWDESSIVDPSEATGQHE